MNELRGKGVKEKGGEKETNGGGKVRALVGQMDEVWAVDYGPWAVRVQYQW